MLSAGPKSAHWHPSTPKWPIFAAIAATRAGLDVAAFVLKDKAPIEPVAAVLGPAVPVGVPVGYLLALQHLV